MKKSAPYLLLSPMILWLTLFLLVPLGMVFLYSFYQRGTYGQMLPIYSLENYRRALDPMFLPVFLRSLQYALQTTFFCLLLGYPLAFFIARFGGERKFLYLFLIMLPFWTSYLVRTYAWIVMLRTEGVLNIFLQHLGLLSDPVQFLNTPFAVTLGLTYGYLPFMTLPIYVSLEKLDPALIEASQDLGAPPVSTFWKVIFPLSLPGVVGGFLLTFVPCVGDFVTPDILGGPDTVMIGNLIQQQFLSTFDWPFGSGVAFLLVAMMIGCITVALKFIKAEEVAG